MPPEEEPLYDAIAEWYDRSVREGVLLTANRILTDTVLELLGDLRGCRVCDIACGQGIMARRLAEAGAQVMGVDLSGKLLEIALGEEREHSQGIVYIKDDAQCLSLISTDDFDAALCHFALMDIPDLEAVARQASRILRAGAQLVVSLTHPCFQVPPGKAYQETGHWRSDNPNGVRGKVGAYHRMLSDYIRAFTSAGFALTDLREPTFPERNTPPFLVVKFVQWDGA